MIICRNSESRAVKARTLELWFENANVRNLRTQHVASGQFYKQPFKKIFHAKTCWRSICKKNCVVCFVPYFFHEFIQNGLSLD